MGFYFVAVVWGRQGSWREVVQATGNMGNFHNFKYGWQIKVDYKVQVLGYLSTDKIRYNNTSNKVCLDTNMNTSPTNLTCSTNVYGLTCHPENQHPSVHSHKVVPKCKHNQYLDKVMPKSKYNQYIQVISKKSAMSMSRYPMSPSSHIYVEDLPQKIIARQFHSTYTLQHKILKMRTKYIYLEMNNDK